MTEMADRIGRVMSETSMIAASLDTLVHRLGRDGEAEPGTREVVEAVLHHPERYRLLDPMRGAWSAGDLHQSPGPYAEALSEQYLTPCPWVVLLETDDRRYMHGDPLVRWNHRTLACLAHSLDVKSPSAVNRWFRLLREHRRLRDRRNAAGLRFAYPSGDPGTRRKVPAHQPSSASSSRRRKPKGAAS